MTTPAPKIISNPDSDAFGDSAPPQAADNIEAKDQKKSADEVEVKVSPEVGAGAPGQSDAKEAGEATKENPAEVNGDSPASDVPKGLCKCCSVKGTPLLGDSLPDEDFKFGERVTTSYQEIVRTQICHASVQIGTNVVLTIPFIVVLTVLCALPVSGNVGATGASVAFAAAVQQVLNLMAVTSPIVWVDPSRQLQALGWGLLCFWPLMLGITMLKWSAQVAGQQESVLSSWTTAWLLPPACVCAIVTSKMNTMPGWRAKWSTCWCVCGGLTRATAVGCFHFFAALVACFVLNYFIWYDNTVFSLDESLFMAILRPVMFTTIKKMFWAFLAQLSLMRHPFMTKSAVVGSSAVLGFATAVAFTKTRTWTALVIFILVNVASHSSRMWVFLGGRFSTRCFLLEWYKQFMVAGKPVASSSKMKLRELRGFENLAQSWGTTFSMLMFLMFYPIVKIGFGSDSMACRFFYPTDLSIAFLAIAYLSEIVMDIHTQITTLHGTKCDYAGLFSLKPRTPMTCGIAFLNAYVGMVTAVAWQLELAYQEEQGVAPVYR